jgi:hypothetical protein
VDENSYLIQKIPAVSGRGRLGKIRKEAAMRLERIPSTVVLHKRIKGIDTRLASIEGPLTHSLAANEFGLRRFETYRRAPKNTNYAFVRLNKLWDKEVEDSTSESEESKEEDEQDDHLTGG